MSTTTSPANQGAYTTTTVAALVAREVAWSGHQSDAGITRILGKLGITADAMAVTDEAVTLGLLNRVPRIGGYVAGRKVNAREFGAEFASFIAGA
jgi:hypothetical protein